jgi:hypothetical protein
VTMVYQPATGLQVLRGRILQYKKTHGYANFFFTSTDQNAMGVVAVAAALAGAGGAAMSTAASASDMEEEADQVEFQIANQPVKGWLWRSPFKQGDSVEVVAEWQGDHYEAYAVVRPKDRVIALYPHCSRGTKAHIQNAIKWWLIGVTGFMIFGWLFFAFGHFVVFRRLAKEFMGFDANFLILGAAMYAFFGLMTIHLTWKWMKFVRLSERIFKVLGWPNPSHMDLIKTSKQQLRKPHDPAGYGVFYFRY